MGPKEVRSSVLTVEEEAIIVAFRRRTLLPLDDCLYTLQPTIPRLTRSALHRCLQRHGISRLPEVEASKPAEQRFASYPIGTFHIDIAEVQTGEGKVRLFVAIDRTSKLAFARLVESAGKMEAADFLRELVAAVPYRIHTVLTDNGVQVTTGSEFWSMFPRPSKVPVRPEPSRPSAPVTSGLSSRVVRFLRGRSVHADLREPLEADVRETDTGKEHLAVRHVIVKAR
jgi:hypothetical protein